MARRWEFLALLMETIWTWKFCVAIYLAKSQGEIKCNLALISAGKKTLKWLLIYHGTHPPPLPPWFNWQYNTELFVSSPDPWKWSQPRWRESSKVLGLLCKKNHKKISIGSVCKKLHHQEEHWRPSKFCDDSSGFSSCLSVWWVCICRFPNRGCLRVQFLFITLPNWLPQPLR